MVGSPHIHMLCGREGGLVGGHGAAAGVEEHTLNLMPKAPSSYNFFVPVDSCARAGTHTHTQVHQFTHTRSKHKPSLLLKRNNDSVGQRGDWVALGAWEEVRCTVHLLCLSILI